MSKVLVRNTKEDRVKEAIEEVFDLFEVNLLGKKVLIKPNMLGAYEPDRGVTTHPAVVRAILEKVLTQTDEVIVGDNPMRAIGTGGSEQTAIKTQIRSAAGKYYRNITQEVEYVNIGSSLVESVVLSKVVREVDYIINVPKFKTHIPFGITGCVKNIFGYVPGSLKAQLHYQLGHPKAVTQFLVELYRFRKPDLNIVDALTGMEGDGPSHGPVRWIGKILAGTNGVEVDAVMASMMDFDSPAKIKTLEIAHKEGLGEIDLGRIEVIGDYEVFTDYVKPLAFLAPKEAVLPLTAEEALENWGKIGRVKPEVNEEKCTQCGACEDICPAEAMILDPYPSIDFDKCISCFCCAENCLEGALSVPEVAYIYERFFH